MEIENYVETPSPLQYSELNDESVESPAQPLQQQYSVRSKEVEDLIDSDPLQTDSSCEFESDSDSSNSITYSNSIPQSRGKLTRKGSARTKETHQDEETTNEENFDQDSGFPCDICNSILKTKKILTVHKIKMHQVKQKCPFCPFEDFRLSKHLQTHHANETLKVAEQKDQDKSVFNKKKDGFPCEICDTVLKTKKILASHKIKMHQVKQKCPFCPYEDFRLSKHIQDEHPEENYKASVVTTEPRRKSERQADTKDDVNCPDSRPDLEVSNLKVDNKAAFPFSCDMCKRRFKSKKLINLHKIKVHKTLHKCPFCSFEARKLSSIKDHVYIKHPQERKMEGQERGKCDAVAHQEESNHNYSPKPELDKESKGKSESRFFCDLCPSILKTKKILYYHKSKYHHVMQKCHLCTFEARKISELRIHVQTDHPSEKEAWGCQGGEFKCLEASCSEISFVSPADLKLHMEGVHNLDRGEETESFLCSTCGKNLSSQSNLLAHQAQHTGYRPYKCRYCDKRFVARYKLKIHERTHNPDSQFKCDEEGCYESFVRKCDLTRHKKAAHLGLNPFKCPHCDLTFPTSQDKDRHRSVHMERKFECEVENCGKAFTKRLILVKHMMAMHTDRRWQCGVPNCRLKFARAEDLEHHKKRIHEAIKPFLCTYCGKRFSSDHSYQLHVRVHTSETPFLCTFCGKAFRRRQVLQNHIRTHTGERPKKCRYCDQSFRQGGQLKRHEQTHTGILPYHCKFCSAQFRDNRPLKAHVSLQHQDCDFDLENPSTYQGHGPSLISVSSQVQHNSADFADVE